MAGAVNNGVSVTRSMPSAPTFSGTNASQGLGETQASQQAFFSQQQALRQEYSPATTFPALQAENVTEGQNQISNYSAALPARYDEHTALKDRLAQRAHVRQAIGTQEALDDPDSKVLRTAPITEEEYAIGENQVKIAEQVAFDQYVQTLVDPRKPGNMDVLMRIYPEFVKRRVEKMNTDIQFVLRNQMIDAWGINDYDDLVFKYMVDNGKIKGPHLATRKEDLGTGFFEGIFGIAKAEEDMSKEGVGLPFSSSTIGPEVRGQLPRNMYSAPNGTLGSRIREVFLGRGQTIAPDTSAAYRRAQADETTARMMNNRARDMEAPR